MFLFECENRHKKIGSCSRYKSKFIWQLLWKFGKSLSRKEKAAELGESRKTLFGRATAQDRKGKIKYKLWVLISGFVTVGKRPNYAINITGWQVLLHIFVSKITVCIGAIGDGAYTKERHRDAHELLQTPQL